MVSDHSSEPWEAVKLPPPGVDFDGYFRIRDKNGAHIATVPTSTVDGKPVGDGESNADRMVACVNACRGLPTKNLNGLPENGLRSILEECEFAGELGHWEEACCPWCRGGRDHHERPTANSANCLHQRSSPPQNPTLDPLTLTVKPDSLKLG